MTKVLEEALNNYIGKEVNYKGIRYTIEDIRDTNIGIKMIFMKDYEEHYFEPSLNLFMDEIIKIE